MLEYDGIWWNLVEYGASFKLDERAEVKKLCKKIMHKVDCLLQHIGHMVQNVARY